MIVPNSKLLLFECRYNTPVSIEMGINNDVFTGDYFGNDRSIFIPYHLDMNAHKRYWGFLDSYRGRILD